MHEQGLIIAGSTLLSGLAFFVGVGATDIIGSALSPPQPYGLQFVSLDYEDGKFHQKVVAVGAPVVDGDWAAQIMRNGEIICSGGGSAPYGLKLSDDPVVMTPRVWVGEPCTVQQGDEARAVWSYRTVDGFYVSITGSHTINKD